MSSKKPVIYLNDSSMMSEVIVRIVLWSFFICLEMISPFIRVIQPEEMHLYKYPHTGFQYVSASHLWIISVVVPVVIMLLDYLIVKSHFKKGMLSLTLLLGLNGFVTVLLKIVVGRPRPDYYYRCWPDGTDNLLSNCTGERKSIIEGRKSFPSGHSSFSFASMTFLSLYLAGRLDTFERNRGQAWRLILTGIPLGIATLIAVSRTCDYHHHWQDVVCGGLIGTWLGYLSYYQYFPASSSTTGTTVLD